MGWYYGEFVCGHKGRIYFKEDEEEYVLDEYFSVECKDCYRQETLGLAKLKGSDKQVEWADNIRDTFLSDLDIMIEKAMETGGFLLEGYEQITVDDLEKIKRAIMGVTDSKYFIDRKNGSVSEIVLGEYEVIAGKKLVWRIK